MIASLHIEKTERRKDNKCEAMERNLEWKVLSQNDENSKPGMDGREMVRRLLGGVGLGYGAPMLAASHPIHKHLAEAATVTRANAAASEANGGAAIP